MARPVKSGLLHRIVINARTETSVSNQTVVGGAPTGVKQWSNGIIKQETSRGYYVQTNDGLGRVRLVATDSLTPGKAFITATDDNGSTYFVTKLTAHKATLVRWNEAEGETWVYESGKTARWSFNDTTDGKVSIENNVE